MPGEHSGLPILNAGSLFGISGQPERLQGSTEQQPLKPLVAHLVKKVPVGHS